ncbi:MAG: aminopeptidase, partial [Acidobacteriota bacterium]
MLPKSFDPELSPGAHNAVHTCLRIQQSERVTLITDLASQEIAAALAHQLDALGCQWNAFRLEDHARRRRTHRPPAA